MIEFLSGNEEETEYEDGRMGATSCCRRDGIGL